MNESERFSISLVSFFLNFISLCATFVIFILYIWRPILRYEAFTLILCLQISDALFSLSYLLIIFKPVEINFLCQFQSFILNFGHLSSIIWTLIIARCIHLSLNEKYYEIHKNFMKLIVVALVFPAIISMTYEKIIINFL